MANITINNLQPTESELIELSNLELDAIVGGGIFSRIVGWISNGINIGGWNFRASWRGGPFISATYRY
jgi:hypothetical protein